MSPLPPIHTPLAIALKFSVKYCYTHAQDRCREYAVITEPMNGLRLVVCGLNGFYRHQHVYTSRSNVVRLQMAAWPRHNPLSTSASGSDVTPARYVIHYEGSFRSLLSSGNVRVCIALCLSEFRRKLKMFLFR